MIATELDHNLSKKLYVQLYEHIRDEILAGRFAAGERLPSIRSTADNLCVSVTTVRTAYDQLMVEGYVVSRPHSGYYVADGAVGSKTRSANKSEDRQHGLLKDSDASKSAVMQAEKMPLGYDPATFDFAKWKKCMTSVLNDSPERLLTESDRQGEPELRKEIAAYLYRSRGVICTQDQVVIGAGTQQLISHIARILRLMEIGLVCSEDPGYLPAGNIFRDMGFNISSIPVKDDGIEIERLPVNVRTAVYISPQHQFPTGAVMPVSRKHQILEWAEANDSIIIEDDYNSELRYSGMPVPALQGFDKGKHVVYLGSFSSTLFPAVRISYMVLPVSMLDLYYGIRDNYDQTCSKTEQLTLALFMQKGMYQTHLRKVRSLYSRKLSEVLTAITESDKSGKFITADSTGSGINLLLRINTRARAIGADPDLNRLEELQREIVNRLISRAAEGGLRLRSVDQLNSYDHIYLLFYYSQIPEARIRQAVKTMVSGLMAEVSMGGLTMPSVYEVVRIKDGKPMFLKDHYERLEASLGSLGMLAPFTYGELESSVSTMTAENNITDHNLKIEVDVSGFSVIYMSPTHYPAAELYETGVKTDILNGERKNPNVKMMDRELRQAADTAIREDGLYEVLLADKNGYITEGSRSNVFFIRGGEVYTSPSDRVLKGVTRFKILEIIREMEAEGKTALHEENISTGFAQKCDAAFISGTSPGVLPIRSMGMVDFDVNDPLLREIMDKWQTHIG